MIQEISDKIVDLETPHDVNCLILHKVCSNMMML